MIRRNELGFLIENNGKVSNEEVGKRIFKLRKDKEMSRAELGKKLNLHETTIKKYEDGLIKSLDIEKVEEFAAALNVTTAFLLGWTKQKDRNLQLTPIKSVPELKLNSFNSWLLPIIGTVKAGTGGFVREECLGYEKSYCDTCNQDNSFYLKVKGDSMEPKISEGDLALVKRQDDIESGELGIVLVNGEEGVIKIIIKGENFVELRSFNPYYPPRIFKNEEMNEIKIVGKVIKTISNW